MWFQRAEADLKYLAHKGNNVVWVVVEEELEQLSCGAATGLAVEFIEPAFQICCNRAGDWWNQMCCIRALAAEVTKWAVVRHAAESAADDVMEWAVTIPIADVIECDVEGLAT